MKQNKPRKPFIPYPAANVYNLKQPALWSAVILLETSYNYMKKQHRIRHKNWRSLSSGMCHNIVQKCYIHNAEDPAAFIMADGLQWQQWQNYPLICWYSFTRLYGITPQKTVIFTVKVTGTGVLHTTQAL